MLVMKFGGTSLGTPVRVRRVATIVGSARARRPLVVVSAHSGVTDMLLTVAARAPAGEVDIREVVNRHREMLVGLDLPRDLVDPLLDELADLTRGMRLVGEASPRAVDYLVSFGERMSARIVAAAFAAGGLPAVAVDAFDAGLRTDSAFGRARPVDDEGRIAGWAASLAPDVVPVVTGFLAHDAHGAITTLGRNGSDFSAALFGHAVDAEEIQIWTDVDGIMTADPKLVADARPIPTLSFDEASELAHYGGKLHPTAIQPAMQKGIPVRVLNTARPEQPGTEILPEFDDPDVVVRSIVYKRGIHLVNLVSPRMLQQHGFLAQVFTAAARHEIDVDVVATSEVSISMTAEVADHLDAFEAELAEVGTVEHESDLALVCVVGRGIARTHGVAAKVLTALAEAEVRVRVISQGAIKVNIALVIAEAELARAVVALHAAFFE